MSQIQNTYTVVSQNKVCPAYYLLTLDAPKLAKAVRPGQFAHIRVSDSLEPLFRRPFSVYRAEAGKVSVLYEAVGQGTRMLALKKKGDKLDVLAPLGRAFTMPSAKIKRIVFIGGGIGVAPFMLFSDLLHKHKAEKILLYGGRDKAHTFSLAAFRKNGVKPFVATDDGSVGVKGRVSELFGRIGPADGTMVYTCGPKAMMASVAAYAAAQGIRGEASMEEVMACGLGACLGCSIPTKSGYRTVCHDGPVFDLNDLIFNQA